MTVGQIIGEAVVEHGLYKKGSKELEDYVIETMAKCGLDHYMLHRFPHQFSGGQRQRIGIARALALKPEFVVCDEAVSALDVSIQSQIINLLMELKAQEKLTYLFISHDLSVIKHISDRIGVMYLGVMVELGQSEEIYDNPLHPYTKALMSAIPTTDEIQPERILLKGEIPSNIFPPSGCKFRTRCPLARERCAKEVPVYREIKPGHFVACHFYEETKDMK
jgi:oligopeptide/dipeptide ABC transporter ATP-binding protein